MQRPLEAEAGGGRPSNAPKPQLLLLPREHGSWALLYGPLSVALLAYGSAVFRFLPFLVCVTALFLAREPLACLVRQRQRNQPSPKTGFWWKWFWIYATVGVLAGLPLLLVWRFWDLLVPAGIALLVLGAHLIWINRKGERNLGAESLGVAGLCLTGVAATTVLRGRLDGESFQLWLLCAFFFASGLLYVRMRIARGVGKNAALATRRVILYHSLLAILLVAGVLARRLSLFVGLAYAPALARAFWPLMNSDSGRLNLKRIGYLEVLYTLLFIVTCGLALRFS